MVKYLLRYKKMGWNIYTDMQDCIIPGVRIISDARQLESFTPETNSCLCLDEIGISFDNRNFKSFPAGVRDWFKFQRKYRVVVFVNSQSYDVDKKIRDCVDGMLLQSSIADVIGVSRPIYKSVSLTEPSAESESRVAEKLKFAPVWKWKFMWMPKYHKYFNSFDAPPRLPIPFKQIVDEPKNARRQLKILSKALRKRSERSDNKPD